MMNDILVEKYRPNTLKDVCGQVSIMKDFKSFVEKKSIPHLLFYGVAGIGKTTTAIAIGKDILESTFGVNFLELNASDERGIDVVREKIKFFAKQQPIQADFKIILLDECDALTNPAQNALRRIMEKFSKNCRFILCCNSISQMIPPLISRCATYNFLPLQTDDIGKRLKFICNKEELQYADNALCYIADSVDGDIRRAIMKLQSTASKGEVNMENIYNDKIEGNFILVIKSLFIDKNFLTARQGIKNFQHTGGSVRELILRIHNYAIKHENIIPRKNLGNLSRIFREVEKGLILGISQQIETDAMIFDILDLS